MISGCRTLDVMASVLDTAEDWATSVARLTDNEQVLDQTRMLARHLRDARECAEQAQRVLAGGVPEMCMTVMSRGWLDAGALFAIANLDGAPIMPNEPIMDQFEWLFDRISELTDEWCVQLTSLRGDDKARALELASCLSDIGVHVRVAKSVVVNALYWD